MSLDSVFSGKAPQISRDPITGTVVRSDVSGVWVAALDSDSRYPTGPCMGARRRTAAGALEQLPVATIVLLVWTPQGPWVAAWEEVT